MLQKKLHSPTDLQMITEYVIAAHGNNKFFRRQQLKASSAC